MKQLFYVLFIAFISGSAFGQQSTDQQLAQYYYSSGDFTKAISYCEREFNKENNKFNFTRFYVCLLKTGKTKDAEKLLKKQINKSPEVVEYKILLIELYEQEKDTRQAEKLTEDLIESNSSSSEAVIELYKEFKA